MLKTSKRHCMSPKPPCLLKTRRIMSGIILKTVTPGLIRLARRHNVAWKPYLPRLAMIASLILRWMQAVHTTRGNILHLCPRIVFLLLIIALSFLLLLRSRLGLHLAMHVAPSHRKPHLPSRLRLPVQATTIIPSISCSIRLIHYLHLLIQIQIYSSQQQLPGVLRWLRNQVCRGHRRNPGRLCRQKRTMRLLSCYGIMLKRQANGKCHAPLYLKHKVHGFKLV